MRAHKIRPAAEILLRLLSFVRSQAPRAALLALLLAPLAARADQDACLKAHEQAQLERMHGRFVEARGELLSCAQASCPALVRGDCKTWLQEVESSLPSLVFAVADEQGRDLVEARVSTENGLLSDHADGRALIINPGVYKVRIEAAGYAPAEQQVSVREGEKRRLVRVVLRALSAERAAAVAPQPSQVTASSAASEAEPSAGERRAKRLMLSGYVLGGVGLAGLVTGVALGAVGKHKLDELRDQCRPNCEHSDVSAGKRKYVLADVAFGAAGALIATAVITWALGYRKQREMRPPPTLSLHVDAQRVSFGWGTRF